MKSHLIHISLPGQGTCSLWNNDKEMIWYHIHKIVSDEIYNGLKLIGKLTLEHVQLNPYSIMKVHLVTQVLSESVSNILSSSYYPDAAHATAQFCKFMDMLFDYLNVGNQYEGNTKKNPNGK